uniref:Predicted protein n=1 Tax=Hordeum vulgare subsp. vulgare TaxID=112509 RepID=F2DTW4_HORVV|nr:predicted protein [Hordeum vulgare subsp. vulgare]
MLANGQISSLEMKEGDDGVGVYLFAAMLLLLAAALYLCCGDCCPGVIDKWRLRRERQEIEL